MDKQDPCKREFVAFRLEQERLQKLKEEAEAEGITLSEVIRKKMFGGKIKCKKKN